VSHQLPRKANQQGQSQPWGKLENPRKVCGAAVGLWWWISANLQGLWVLVLNVRVCAVALYTNESQSVMSCGFEN
jgi:hypothetical protein